MKVLATLSLAGYATASFLTMSVEIKNGINRAVAEARSNGDRNLDQIFGAGLNNIRDYGCWCFFLEEAGNGKSSPVDAIDRLCKDLQHGYACAVSDVFDATGDDSCDPTLEPYFSGTSFGLEGVVDSCNALNVDFGLCAQLACMVEGVFVIQTLQAFVSVNPPNPDNLHSNGFDFKNGCPINTDGPGGTERLCCGVQPYRFQYRPLDRECCGVATFDPALQTCCADGIPRFSCV